MQPNTIPLFHFSSVGVEGSMLTALLSVLVRVTAFDILLPYSLLSAKPSFLYEASVSAIRELWKRLKTTTIRRESWLPELHDLSL